jgi:exopolysaccharide biosynthesis protein
MRALLSASILFFLAVSCASILRQPSITTVISQQIEDFVPQWQELYPGLALSSGKIKYPRLEFWALRVNLADENLEIIVNDGENLRNGSLPSLTVSSFAAQYGCIAAMNAGPFSPVSNKIGEDRILTGVFVSNGRLVSLPNSRYSALLFYDDGRGAVAPQRENIDFNGIRHAVGGFYTILENSVLVERASANKAKRREPRHPRSAAGVSAEGFTLYLLVIDGRRLGSIGATERETGRLLLALGAEDGILMDGGGSSALALDVNGDDSVQIINRPVHGGIAGNERAVATCIGVRHYLSR